MRLVFDAFPCQTSSRLRGIGRFTRSLGTAMAQLRGQHDMHVLANALYPESVDALRQDFRGLLPPGRFAAYASTDHASHGAGGIDNEAIAMSLILRAYEEIAPDVVLYANPFEGWQEKGVVALPRRGLPAAMRVGILYDLIPWLFREHYLDSVPSYKAWYLRRMESLREFDLLLAISDATRQDAMDVLNIPGERIVNISGSISAPFCALLPSPQREVMRDSMIDAEREIDLAALGITRPFVLYTGNGDYRKNQDGLLRAYARLPEALRQGHQLVLNQVGDKVLFDDKVRSLGLDAGDIAVTGHVTDMALRQLYQRCKVFIFPSLYEGFGLPILEAMACGAPVIAANNSSIPEVVGRRDVLFDAGDPDAIARALEHVLTDDRLRDELARYGIARAGEFGWHKSAMTAWKAIEARLEETRAPVAEPPAGVAKPRVAFLFVVNQQHQDSLHHTQTYVPLLSRHFDIDLFVLGNTDDIASAFAHSVRRYPVADFPARYDAYAACVYQLADTAAHSGLLPFVEAFPGLVVLHSAKFDSAVEALSRERRNEAVLANEIIHTHGLQGLVAYLREDRPAAALALNRHLLESAQHVLVPDSAMAELLNRKDNGAWLPPTTVLGRSPDNAAGLYARAIAVAMRRDERHTIREMADALQDGSQDDTGVRTIAGCAAYNKHLRMQPRLLLDVTQLSKTNARSGIQRVVRNIARELGHMATECPPLELVRQADGKLWRADAVAASIFGIDQQRIPAAEVTIHPGDTLLMIDSSWEQYEFFSDVFQRVRSFGGKIVTVVYDLIPLRHPGMCDAGLVAVFRRWFGMAISESDMLLCISRSVADEVRAYVSQIGGSLPRPVEIRHWPLGADIAVDTDEAQIRPEVRALAADAHRPLFLMVGTVEPRKGHGFVLDAFDAIWDRGGEARLCIAGGVGWMVDETMRRIRTHSHLHDKLFFVEKFTDAEINHCYSIATALIAASVAEGFGLPIVEAALHRVPVLASDIPVFREVGGDGALYFSLEDKGELPAQVDAISEMSPSLRRELAMRVTIHTWRESAEQLRDIVLERDHSAQKVDMKAA